MRTKRLNRRLCFWNFASLFLSWQRLTGGTQSIRQPEHLQRSLFRLTPNFPYRRVLALSLLLPATALAGPTGEQVTAGNATISRPNAVTTLITQQTQKAIIDWQNFSIAQPEMVRFQQPGTDSIALNRVLGHDPTRIYGSLTANGQVFLVNPNGVLFAPGSQVSVHGLLATTHNLNNDDFLAGRYTFAPQGNPNNSAEVANQGTLQAGENGYIVLAGDYTANTGVISARLGQVTLASGNRFTIDLEGDRLIGLAVDEASLAQRAGVENFGALSADGGQVVMTARVANELATTVVNNTGLVQARSIEERNGEIILHGSSIGIVANSGTLDASGKGADESGGNVKMLGEKVGLTDHALVDVSGSNGGGTALIGGDYQGKNPEIRNAKATYLGKDSVIKADAIENGNGGKVIVWSDDATRAYGSISAQGGQYGGDGGFVEVSGKGILNFQGRVDTRAPLGKRGTLLLDPTSINLVEGSGTDDTPANTFYEDNITTNLGFGNVILQTSSGDTGNITFTAGNYDFSSANTTNSLTLLAFSDATDVTTTGNINLPTGTLITMYDGTPLHMMAGWNGIDPVTPAIQSYRAGSGNIDMVGTASITTRGGDISLLASGNISLAGTLNTSGKPGAAGSPGGAGGSGGNISISAAHNLTFANITMNSSGGLGGDGNVPGANGGAGGNAGTMTALAESGALSIGGAANTFIATGGDGGDAFQEIGPGGSGGSPGIPQPIILGKNSSTNALTFLGPAAFNNTPGFEGLDYIGASGISAPYTDVRLKAGTCGITQSTGAVITGGMNLNLDSAGDVALSEANDFAYVAGVLVGNISVNGLYGIDTLSAGGNILLSNSGQDILQVNDITYSGSTNATISLVAGNNIVIGNGAAIKRSGGTGTIDIILNSDNNGGSGGAVWLDTGSALNSYGGNIVIGGGANPNTGYAVGNGSATGGKTLNNGITVLGNITAGSGNVSMHGEGANINDTDGITFKDGLLSSNGTVTIDGKAHKYNTVTGTETSAGVDFLGNGTRLSTHTGTVLITGLNDAPAGAPRAQGITIEAGTIIESTGTGTLTLNGTSTSLDNAAWGVGVFGGTIQTTAAGGGAITIFGTNVSNPDGGLVIWNGHVLSGGGAINIIGESAASAVGMYNDAPNTLMLGGPTSGNIIITGVGTGDISATGGYSGPINAGIHNLTIISADGKVKTPGTLSGADISLVSGTSTSDGITVEHDITATGNLSLITTDTNIKQAGGTIKVDGLTTAHAGTSDIDLYTNGATNNFNIFTAQGGSIKVRDDNSITIGLLDAGAGVVNITAGDNINDGNGTANNIKAATAMLVAGVANMDPGSIDLDTQVQILSVDNSNASNAAVAIRNSGSPLIVTAEDADTSLSISNNNHITTDKIGGGNTDVVSLTATGAASDIYVVDGDGPGSVRGSAVSLNAGCDINITNSSVQGSTFTLTAGGDVLLTGSEVFATDTANVTAGVDVKVVGGSNDASIGAVNDVNITATTGKLYLTSGDGTSASVEANVPQTVYLNVPGQSSGGYVIDGVEGGDTISTENSNTGIFAAGDPAVVGNTLQITYAKPQPPQLPTLAECTANPTLTGCSTVLPTLDTCISNHTTPGCTAVLPSLATCTATPTAPGCNTVLPSLATCTSSPTAPGCTAVLPSMATCTTTPTAPGCTAVLPSLSTCTTTPTTPGCTAVLPTLATCTTTPTAPGCTAVLPSLSTCTTTPTTPGCTAVLPTLATCTTTPTAPGCTAVLPSLSTCTTTPTTPGCTAVLPTLATCTTTPTAPGCTAVLPSLSTCTTTPTTPGCTAVLPTLATCTTTPTAPGCTAVLPSLSTCTTTPTTPGCTAVLPTLATCTTTPTAPGCTAVLPSLSTCTTTPTTPGCTAVLPTLVTCTTTPTAPGCTAVLPSLSTCTTTPTTPGCTAVLPTLATCTTTPTAPGCTAVLPSLSTCTTTPTTPGCTAVLPTLATCTTTPTAPGCTAVLPSLSTCTTTPTTPGCTAVLPTLATCTTTPTAPGCTAVLPSLSTCTTTPTTPGCTVILPPFATCTTNPTLPGCSAVLPPALIETLPAKLVTIIQTVMNVKPTDLIQTQVTLTHTTTTPPDQQGDSAANGNSGHNDKDKERRTEEVSLRTASQELPLAKQPIFDLSGGGIAGQNMVCK